MKTPLRRLFLSTLLGLLTAVPHMYAQDSAPIPAEPPVDAADTEIGTLVLSDESALQVLDLLEQLTDKIILRRQDLPATKINFNSRGTITKGDAVLALESLLTLNNIMLTDMGGRFMKAVPATDVNRHVPEMLLGSTLEMEPSQQIYAKLFRFEYLNAEQSSGTIIQPLQSQNSSQVLFPKSNALLLTDALINLQRIESVIAEADQPQQLRETMKFVKLNFIQAREMEQNLNNLIKGPLKSYLEGNTNITADERTNQLIIVTPPGNMEMIMNVIESVDVDAAPLTASEVFPLRQAKAEEVVSIIENIISGQEKGREEDAKITRNESNQLEGKPTQPELPQAPAQVAAKQTTGTESTSALQFSSFVGLSADERTNAIVAYGTQSDLKTIKGLIEKIDIPLPQVRIEAIITEVSLRDNQSSGITSFGFTLENGDLAFGTDLTQDSDGNITQGVGGVFGSGFAFTGNTNGLINAVLRTAESDSDVRVISTPTIVVSHNEEGVVNVSESRPIITSSSSTLDSSNTNVRSNVEFRDIGIQLTATPLIGADGSVQMKIEQTVDSVAGEVEIDGNKQPIIGRREATSTITVNSGEVIVLGGLQENRRSESNAYFPVLGKLPLLNKIFGGDSNTYNRTDLVIFIRPTVINSSAEASAMTQKQLDVMDEADAVDAYIATGTTSDTYLEGSKFEKEEREEEESKPFIKINWP